jgi:hypothetical protein
MTDLRGMDLHVFQPLNHPSLHILSFRVRKMHRDKVRPAATLWQLD